MRLFETIPGMLVIPAAVAATLGLVELAETDQPRWGCVLRAPEIERDRRVAPAPTPDHDRSTPVPTPAPVT